MNHIKERINQHFRDLGKITPSNYPKLLQRPYYPYYPFPKKSKILSTNLLKDVNYTDEPRQLVMIGHLYFNYILQQMLNKESHNLSAWQQESFHAKADFLHRNGKLDEKTFASLVEINQLRNIFAHQLFYDLSCWSPANMPVVQEFNLNVPKRKSLLRAFNIVLLRLCFFSLIVELEIQHR